MSFGFSVSDFMALIQLTTRTYQGWKKACGEYTDITKELNSLKIILSRVAVEIQAPTSLTHHDHDLGQLQALSSNCRDIVSQLEAVVSSYQGIVIKSRRSNWDRIQFSQKNLGGLREKLTLQIATLGTYLDVLGVSAIGRVENSVRELPQMKKVIDGLAADIRAGRREGSAMTTYENDEKEVWRQFRRELIAEGFSSESLKKTSGLLRNYVREVTEAGLLDEEVPQEIDNLPAVTDKEERKAKEILENRSPENGMQWVVETAKLELERGDQSNSSHAIHFEVKEMNSGCQERCKANSSCELEEVLRLPKQESRVRSHCTGGRGSQVTSSQQAPAEEQPHTLTNQTELQLAGKPEPAPFLKDVEVKQDILHVDKDSEGTSDFTTFARVAQEDRMKIENRQREQRKKRRNREIRESCDPERKKKPQLKKHLHVSEGDLQADGYTHEMPGRVLSDPEVNSSSKVTKYQTVREGMRSSSNKNSVTHDPPYPQRIRRKRGREFGKNDVLGTLQERENEKKSSQDEKGEGGEIDDISIPRGGEKERKLRKEEVERSKARGYEDYEALWVLRERENTRKLQEQSLSPRDPAPTRPSTRQSSSRDKRRLRPSREYCASPYYEDLEAGEGVPPERVSESKRQAPRRRRSSTTPLSKRLPSQSGSIQTLQDRTPTTSPGMVRAATATPLTVPSLSKQESSLPKHKHSLSKITLPRLSYPKQESPLPKRMFSLPKLSFMKWEYEDLPLRTVRQSRSYADSRTLSSPAPPFDKRERIQLQADGSRKG